MQCALTGDCPGLTRLLLLGDNTSLVNISNMQGTTALMVAAWKGHSDVVRLLLAVPGINVNAADSNGHTALMMHMMGQADDRTTRDLLEAFPGINQAAKNKAGEHAYDMLYKMQLSWRD